MIALERGLLLALCLLTGAASAAPGVYQKPEDFVREVFSGAPPVPKRLWIKGALREQIRQILGHDLGRLRLRYWQEGDRTAWILEEVGKEQPITVGIVVQGDRIETLRVLVFRESRGWEVRHPFFTEQFRGAGLGGDHRLDRPIDGITGATLSVRAVRKLARLALLLHHAVMSQAVSGSGE